MSSQQRCYGLWFLHIMIIVLLIMPVMAAAQEENATSVDAESESAVTAREVMSYFVGDWSGSGEAIGAGSDWTFTSSIKPEVNGTCQVERVKIGDNPSEALFLMTTWRPDQEILSTSAAARWGERWTITSVPRRLGEFFVLDGTSEGCFANGKHYTSNRFLQVVDADHFIACFWNRRNEDNPQPDSVITFIRDGAEGKADTPAILREFFSDLLEDEPENAAALRSRGYLLAAIGEHKQAAQDLAKATQLLPDDHWLAYVLAPLLRETDTEAYLAHCKLIRERASDPSDPMVYGRALMACLLHPSTVDDWKQFTRMAEDTFHRSPPSQKNSRNALVGMAWFRAGDNEEAERWLRWSLASEIAEQATIKSLLALSMVYSKQGKTDDAKEILAKVAEKTEAAFPVSDDRYTRAAWHDALICELMRQEAEELLSKQ